MSQTSQNRSSGCKVNCSAITIGPTTNNSKPLHQLAVGTEMNMGITSLKPQLLPSTTSTGKNTAAQQRTCSRVAGAFVPPARPTTEPRTVHSKITPPRQNHDSIQKEQGPWSREAFDLFDWKPEVGNTADPSAVT
jgi:hypothetical protein